MARARPRPGDRATVGDEATAFVRVMVLPRALRGLPSYRPWSEADAAMPRPQHFTLFLDEPIEL
jgi:hypothetical protein